MSENIIISPELKNILPPLTPDEFKILEENLLVEGCREPLMVWNNILVDGHNRYAICTKHNIQFRTDELEADNIEDVKIWIIDHQKGRRNLTDGWKFELVQVRKEILLKQGEVKRNPGFLGNQYKSADLSTIDKTPHNTQKEIASELGWSTGKVAMAEKVWSKGTDEVKNKIKGGEISFNEAYKEIKKEERRLDKKQFNKNILLPEGKYSVIYADPAWPVESIVMDKWESPIDDKYPTMSIQDIKNLPIKDLTADDCSLFIWTTHSFLPDALEIIKEWEFKYFCIITWNKGSGWTQFGFHKMTEFLLYAYKGKMNVDQYGKAIPTLISENKTYHSKKPDSIRELIKEKTPSGRLELFARDRFDGWTPWGNEIK